MVKKAKKRKFSPEHMAALRAAHAKRRGKPRSKVKRRGPYKLDVDVVANLPATTLTGQLDRFEQLLKRFEALT